MRRIFKDISISQLEELMKRLKEKVKKGGFDEIEDCELLVQAYAAAEELKDIKSKGPLFDWTDIKASAPPEDREVLCVDLDGDIWMAHYSKISKAWYACGYGDRIKDIVAWMEIPDYAAEERHCHD
ncbi:MAG: hypothetical protein II003_03580 [Methanobrevibacter sp.]|nr:hypothetical protein [Methanobrevibacter sp.]